MLYLDQFQDYLQGILVKNKILFKIKKQIINTLGLVLSLGLGLMLTSNTLYANEDTTSICKPVGYVLGFFNGVWNTPNQASNSLRKIKKLMPQKKYKNENIEYELFYNQTGQTRDGATALEDLAEVFRQRAVEFNGVVVNRWELFWETLTDTSDELSFKQRIKSLTKAHDDLLNSIGHIIISTTMALRTTFLSNPPTHIDFTRHSTRIKALVIEKKKLLLVAHSQGNFFANYAYDKALSITDAKSVKTVHIAPASATLRGEHILANIDVIINLLRVQGLTSVPPINTYLSLSHLSTDDASGHTLVNTYLNQKRQTRSKVQSAILTALDDLITPNTQGNSGFFTATLTWDGKGDLDLHTFEPKGAHVYYSQDIGQSGFLDVDNTVANGPEHYYASCEPDVLQVGVYKIGINNYSGAEGRIATLQIATTNKGEIFTKTLQIGSVKGSDGNSSPIEVVKVEVAKDYNGLFVAFIKDQQF